MVPIRTLTLGVPEPHPLAADVVAKGADALRRAEAVFRDAGYEVQTLRLSTRPVFDDMTPTVAYARDLQAALDDAGLTYCSLGPATSGVETIPDLLIGNDALNCTVRLDGNTAAARPVAEAMLRLANETEEGFGNFRFAALACVPPGSPFFPAAYHQGPANLTVGLQGASIAVGAAKGGLDGLTERFAAAVTEEAAPVVRLAERVAAELGVAFGGIDLSPAPNGADSIGAAFEEITGEFGAPGTLAVAAALTAGIRSTDLPTCGYNGLMLPVMEDVVLARRWEEGRIGLHDLLAYSSVCGTGLDTVPLPGDSSADAIARLLLDVTALAVRLRKPLSARLFPVPGTRDGDRTAFTSEYLTDTTVRW
ncbi:hypothetical protein GCM10023195_85680 [Actinoallomurus liliacearum]|uniref:DUF711 family protein n=1 Tax=Actinoallomurus liliacearum TaxID=1080073 RepID=A0ABP8U0T5_9ACTN